MKEPFSDDDAPVRTNSVKQVSSVKSIFDDIKKPPSKADFDKAVQIVKENMDSYKQRAFELGSKFKKMLEDKTVEQNKNIFAIEIEKELLQKMIQLAIDINNDENEKMGMGSIGWIVLLLKSVLWQRDRINKLEYELLQVSKKISQMELDKPKSGG